ncbi:MAG: DUF1501 domain-containing protein, partial [Planctomycetaceae bacterium]|nr:DUF1501 domain-containing protein [Planctomycetaceae bacterium]
MNKSSPGNLNRREWIRAGSLGLLGISMADVAQWQQQATAADAVPRARNVIYIFLTGGPSQHDTFDMKPDGPADYKGEFNPIATNTPGLQICEHLPGLAQRSHLWGLVRSLTHKESGHGKGTYVMLTGQSTVPLSFRSSQPQSTDLPSIAAISGVATRPRGNMPTSVILPEKIYHSNTGVYPGQFAGLLGSQHEPWLVECTDKPHAYHDYSG